MKYVKSFVIFASLATGVAIGCFHAAEDDELAKIENMNEKDQGESTGTAPSTRFDLPVAPLETIEWVEEHVSETAADMVADHVEERADSVHIDPAQGEVVKAQVNLYRGKKKAAKMQDQADEIGLATQELAQEIAERKERRASKKRCN